MTGSPDAVRRQGPKHYVLAGQVIEPPTLAPGLHVVATPIGNLRDVTLRALDMLAAADLIACEDTRITRRLLDRYGIKTELTRYDDHNAELSRPRLLAALAAGLSVALASDAGTPLISDPGYKLVRAAHEAGYRVSAAPGPSAVLMALAIAGLPTDRFLFDGFLPAKGGPRRARIAALKSIPATLVLFETAPRLKTSLEALADELGPRPAVVCRELTKIHEEVVRDDLCGLAQRYAQSASPPRGEIVLVVAPPADDDATLTLDAIDTLLRQELASRSVKDTVEDVAARSGRPRREIYRRALALKQAGDDGVATTCPTPRERRS
jgi:16S rRNA (cytidine1402-2'-O)-methyltransferase